MNNTFYRLHSYLFSALFVFTLLLTNNATFAQNVLDDIQISERGDPNESGNNVPDLAKETILKISPSKKIFLLSNESQTFGKGDFISLLLNTKLAVRALVAKTTDDKVAGIKITKIYSLQLWNQLKSGLEVQVLKGDDSYFTTKEKKAEDGVEEKVDSKIQEEDDLFNTTTLGGEDDITMEDNQNRLIRPDNLLSLNVGLIEGKDNDGSSRRYTQLNGSWAYQLVDNIWGEFQIGTNVINDFPSTEIDTRLINLTVRGKYTFSGPFYTYFQPYIGYQVIRADSPGAGNDDGRGFTEEQLQAELDLVDDSAKSRMIFGVTALKRIVPGWFIRADLGLDIVSGGLTLEF